MKKYLEQTSDVKNPACNRRRSGRRKAVTFVKGTRWVYDESSGTIEGEDFQLSGESAALIVEHCKEVEPGFGAIVSKFEYQKVIGQLIDQGKITVADIQAIMKDDYELDDEEGEEGEGEFEEEEAWLFHLRQLEYRYRHWICLDPPSEELIQNKDEESQRNEALRTKKSVVVASENLINAAATCTVQTSEVTDASPDLGAVRNDLSKVALEEWTWFVTNGATDNSTDFQVTGVTDLIVNGL